MADFSKNCPFCGDDAESLTVTCKDVKPGIRKSKIECLNCGASGPDHYDGESAESARIGAWYQWDQRPAPSDKRPFEDWEENGLAGAPPKTSNSQKGGE